MQGLVTVTDVSADQVDAMAGGATLRSQALAFGVVRNPKQLNRTMGRLLAALQQVARQPQQTHMPHDADSLPSFVALRLLLDGIPASFCCLGIPCLLGVQLCFVHSHRIGVLHDFARDLDARNIVELCSSEEQQLRMHDIASAVTHMDRMQRRHLGRSLIFIYV